MATPSIDLMILGALKEAPMSAYDMDKLMEARALRKWVRVSTPSIYRNLIKLCESGFVEGAVVREGSAPEKTVYTITDSGRERFDELMRKVADAPARVDFDFTPVIANLYVTDEESGRKLLATIRERYREQAEKLAAYAPEVPRLEARANLELRAATYALAIDWLDRFERDFYRPGVPAELRGWAEGMAPEASRETSVGDGCGASAPTFDWDEWRAGYERRHSGEADGTRQEKERP